MRLLIITQAVDLGDTNLGFFHEWILRFSHALEFVDVIAQRVGKHHLPANVGVFGVKQRESDNRIIKLWRMLKLLLHLVPSSDCVFVHMAPAYVIIAWPFTFFYRKPVVLWYVHKQVDWKLRIAEKMVRRIISASPESFRLKSNKLLLLGHGIDTALFTEPRTEPQGCILFTAGRISRSKNLNLLLEGVAMASLDLPTNWKFVVSGEPITADDRVYLRELLGIIAHHGIGEHVVFTGGLPHREMLGHYQLAVLFLHASTTGSIDKAVLEAMSTGLPVISSSEAFPTILPKEYVLTAGTAEDFCRAIKLHWNTGRDPRLRKIIEERFDLSRLVSRIIGSMKEL